MNTRIKILINPDLEGQFASKKFAIRCESEKTTTSKVKKLINETPSASLSKSNYERAVSWLISRFTSGNVLIEDIGSRSKVTEYLDWFFQYKDKLEVRDLNQYENPAQIFTAVEPLVGSSDKSNVIPSKVKNAKLVGKNEYGEIWTPLTAQASCELGKGTEWCTAKYKPGDDRNKFDHYNDRSPLYIWFDRSSGKRLQYHNNSKIMDEYDTASYSDKFVTLLSDLGLIGNLDLDDSKITSLPENLKVHGNLDLGYSRIISLPEGLEVDGEIVLRHTKVVDLPKSLKVGGNLRLQNTLISQLPENLEIGGDLVLSRTNVTSLPNGLKVGGSLRLPGSSISSLPENLKVGEDLVLNPEITSLPENLKVGGNIYCSFTSLSHLPKKLDVGGFIYLGPASRDSRYTLQQLIELISERNKQSMQQNISRYLKCAL